MIFEELRHVGTVKMRALIVILILSSCGAQFHVNRANHHQEKAMQKGAVFTPDTTLLLKHDTIERHFYRNDTLVIERTFNHYYTSPGEIRFITNQDKRQDRKKEKREDQQQFKLDKIKAQGEKAAAKKTPWGVIALILFFFLVGIIVAVIFIAKYLIKKNAQPNQL